MPKHRRRDKRLRRDSPSSTSSSSDNSSASSSTSSSSSNNDSRHARSSSGRTSRHARSSSGRRMQSDVNKLTKIIKKMDKKTNSDQRFINSGANIPVYDPQFSDLTIVQWLNRIDMLAHSYNWDE